MSMSDCDGNGNIVRSIDISCKKEYNYEYEESRIVRATEADIDLSGEIVTSKVIVNTVKYYYDTEGKMTKKVITPANGSAQTTYYENKDDSTVVKFSAGGRTVTSHSGTDSFGRKVFDELQLGTDFVSRQFVYHAGQVAIKTKSMPKKTLFLEHRSVYEKVVFYHFNFIVRLYRFIIM